MITSLPSARAALLSWDGSDIVTAGAQGGVGNWNVNSTANWWNGSANVVWPALGGTNDDAFFGGAAGTVTLTSAITANDLIFNTTGYILSGAEILTLNGTTPTITTDPGVTATISNVIAGTVGLVKAGPGTLTLSGSNTYTGATTINSGLLAINGSTAAGSAVTVSAGGALGGTGTVNGNITMAVGGGINLTKDNAVGTLNLGGTLTFNGTAANQNSLTFDLSSGGTTTDQIATTNVVTAATANSVVINLKQLGTAITPGTYTLINSTSGSSSNTSGMVLATTRAGGNVYSLTNTAAGTGSVLQVGVSAAIAGPAAAFWSGATNTTWETTTNWNTTATSETSTGAVPGVGTNVFFATTTPVAGNLGTTLAADYEINSLTYNADAAPTTIASAGGKMLTIDATGANGNTAGNGITTNNFSGTNTISAKVGLGNSQTWTVANSGTLAVSGGITDFGSGFNLTKSGTGALTLSGTNTFSTLTVSQGSVAVNTTGALNPATSVVLGDANTGATALSMSFAGGTSVSYSALTVASGITGATMNSSATTLPKVTGLTTLNSPLTLNRTATGNTGFEFVGRITGNGGGSGNDSLIFTNGLTGDLFAQFSNTIANDYLGNFHVKSGGLKVQFGFFTGAGNNLTIPDTAMVIIDPGATFNWNNGTGTALETIDGLSSNNASNGGSMTKNAATYTLTINANNSSNDGNRIFTGNLINMTGNLTLGGSGTQEFSGATPTFGNVTNLNKGTLKLTKTTGWGSNIVVGASNSPTLQLNSALLADSWTFSKQITGGSANAKIEKIGPGTTILTPAASSTFVGSTTGALTVTGGRLYLNNANFTTAPAVSVGSAATFGGTGTAGNITVAGGGTLEGGMAGTGTLTAANVTLGTVAADSTTLKGSLSTTAGYKALAVTNLAINGGNQSVTLDVTGLGLVNNTTYDLLISANAITAPNASSVLASLRSNSRTYTPVVDGTGKKIQATYDANASVYWTGAAGPSWDTSTANWKLTGNNNNTLFQANDVVFFHNTANADEPVDITGADVNPLSSTFDNTTVTSYTVQGSNGISAGSLTKSGNGILTITNANSYSGGTNISAGRVRVGNNSALGTGTITFTGGALSTEFGSGYSLVNSVAINGPATLGDVTDNGSLAFAGALSGSGALSKAGTGTLTLSGTGVAYNGAVAINDGVLALNHATALGTANAITIGAVGATAPTLTIQVAANVALGPVTTPANVTGASISMPQNTSTFSHTIAGATLASPLTIQQSNTAGANWSQITWTSKITGTGGGSGSDTLIFNNTGTTQNYFTTNSGVLHDFSGNVHVLAGLIAVQSGNPGGNLVIPDSSMLIVDSGANWRWNGGAFTETVDGLSGGGSIITNAGSYNLTINANNSSNEGNRVFSGIMVNPASALNLGGTGTQEFSGANLNFSAGTNVNNGTLRLTKTTAWNSNVSLGASNSPTLQLNSPLLGDSWTFFKQITGGFSNAKIEKTGPGTAILAPASGSNFIGSTTGALTVTGGSLYLTSAFTTAPAVSVATNATFGGTSTVGNITVASGGVVEGGMSGIGTLTAGNLTLGTLAADTTTLKGSLSTGYNAFAVTNLTINGGNQSVTLNASGLGLTNGGTYDLLVSTNPITAPNASSVLASLKSNSRAYTPVVDGTGTKIQMTYDATASIYWTGANSAAWDTAVANFKITANNADTQFQGADVVFFNDNPSSSAVDISSGDVLPVATVFANSIATSYTLQGTNGIASGSFTKTGNGTLSITNDNNTSGAVALNGGTTTIASSGGLGVGTLSFGGGALAYTGAPAVWTRAVVINTDTSSLDVDATTTLALNGPLTGTGTLTKAGAGTLLLGQTSGTISANFAITNGALNLSYGAGAVTYSGIFSGNGGVLQLTGTGASATTGLTLTGGSTFTGDVEIYGRRIFLDSSTGNALSGANIVFKTGFWPWHDLTLNRDEQIADAAVLRWDTTNNTLYEFRLNGHTETVGGLQCSSTLAIIENAGFDSTVGNDNNTPAGTLIVDTASNTSYFYNGSLRDLNNGTGNGALSFEKRGSGTQILTRDISYTGPTTVTAGTLQLTGTTAFVSAVALNGGTLSFGNGSLGTGTVTMNGGSLQWEDGNTQDVSSKITMLNGVTATFDVQSNDVTLAGSLGAGTSASLVKKGAGTLILSGTNSYSGTTTVSNGILQIGDGATNGTLGSGAITNTTSLVFNRSDTLTVPNSISGAGTVTNEGGAENVLNLDGPQNYAILFAEAGTTNVSGSFTSGTAIVNANANVGFYANQSLGALNIADGVTVTLGGTPPPAPEIAMFAASAPVPEPGSVSLLLLGVLGIFGRRRRDASRHVEA